MGTPLATRSPAVGGSGLLGARPWEADEASRCPVVSTGPRPHPEPPMTSLLAPLTSPAATQSQRREGRRKRQDAHRNARLLALSPWKAAA